MTRQAERFIVQQQLKEMNFDKPAFVQHPTLLGVQPESPECEQFDSAHRRTLRRRRVMPQVHWMPSLMPAQARRQMPQGAQIGHPRPKGAAKGIVPCEGNVPGCEMNFGSPRIGILVSCCSERPQKRMPSHIRIGAVRSRMP